jgi:hypothetical protein
MHVLASAHLIQRCKRGVDASVFLTVAAFGWDRNLSFLNQTALQRLSARLRLEVTCPPQVPHS